MSGVYEVEIRHNFETAHRLFGDDAPEKCRSIHGHSWWVTVTLAGRELDEQGMLVEFGAFKSAWRGWLDSTVDHHLVMSVADPLVVVLREMEPEHRLLTLPWSPTTENLAAYLHGEASRILRTLDAAPGARVSKVHLQETSVNAAAFTAR
ncbi:MAG: 6-pyruvoyltetrahydropterin/6-carboxytetrahydropterin synthase [Bradymonadia bacterium]|jgi:6-pyruvoyltetrahydropterin/6-carboxytetrahydropterin synthase